LLRLRGERLEQPFAHLYETGGFNLGLLMRQPIGVGTPRGLQGRVNALMAALLARIGSLPELATRHRRTSPLEDRSIARCRAVDIGGRDMAFTSGC
jgi:hypothetical protein